MSAYETQVSKDESVPVPPGTKVSVDGEWVPLVKWDKLATGPTILEVEISAELGAIRPTDIQTRWRRPNHDTTKRHTHAVGSIKAWSAVSAGLEYINPGDLPIVLEIWQKAGQMVVNKVVAKAYNPAQDISERTGR